MKIKVTKAVRRELWTLCFSASKATERRMFVRDNANNPDVDNAQCMNAAADATAFDREVLSTAHRIASLLILGGGR